MDSIERLLNAAVATEWRTSPAIYLLGCVLFTATHNKLRGKS